MLRFSVTDSSTFNLIGEHDFTLKTVKAVANTVLAGFGQHVTVEIGKHDFDDIFLNSANIVCLAELLYTYESWSDNDFEDIFNNAIVPQNHIRNFNELISAIVQVKDWKRTKSLREYIEQLFYENAKNPENYQFQTLLDIMDLAGKLEEYYWSLNYYDKQGQDTWIEDEIIYKRTGV